MLRISKLLLAVGASSVALGASISAQAQTFSEGTFTTDGVLSVAGAPAQEVYGVALANGSSSITTANSYNFFTSTGTPGQTDISNVDAGSGYSSFLAAMPSVTSGDTNFDSILNDGRYYGTGETYMLNGLTGGQKYSLLIFTADDRTHGGFANFEIQDGTATSALQNYFFSNGNGSGGVEGGYILDTFTEAGTGTGLNHTFTVANPGNGVELEGILVEKVVPEPASFALLGLGLSILLISVRCRRPLNS